MRKRPAISRAVYALVAGSLIVLSALGPLRSGAAVPNRERVRALEAPKPMGDATLTDQDGAAFTLESLHGGVALILFGYTNCPDVCPVAMERLRELHDSGLLAPEEKVTYVLISVDGDRDTAAAVKAFLAKYSTDFIGLTAPPAAVKPIATRFSASFFEGGHDHGGHYTVAHSSQIFAVDPAGNVRAEIYGASLEAMADVVRALNAETSEH
jgi:protein SCO1